MNTIYKTLALLLLPLTAMAQTQTITLEQCREMALKSSYALKSSQENIASAEDMLKAYKSNNLPNFSMTGGYLYSSVSFSESITGGYLPTFTPNLETGEMIPNIAGTAADGSYIFSSYAYMPDINFDFEMGSVYNVGLMATQPIYMGGKISTATKLAQLGIDVATIERTRSEADVIVSAEQAFYTYLKVEEMQKSAEAYRNAVDEFYRQLENLLSRGMCTKNDLMKVQVKVNEAELSQLKAKNALVLARMNLCYAIGLPMTTQELKVIDMFDSKQAVDISLDVSSRPEFELLAKSIEAKELEVKLAQSDFMPSVSAVATYSYMNGMKLSGERVFGSSPSFTGGVTVNIPIFHWGEGRRKVSAARREVTVAENTKADLEQKMTLELLQSINAYHEAQAQVVLMERSVEQADENLRQSGKLYAVGMETVSEHLEAQALWQKSMSDLVEAKSNQRLAYVRYCRVRGESSNF